MKKILSILILFTTILLNAHSQQIGSKEIKVAKQLFKGTWYNKSEKLYMQIYFDHEELKSGYVTINLWKKGNDRGSCDAFKAYIKGQRLIMYASNTDLRSPYSEMSIKNAKLIWQENDFSDLNSQQLKQSETSSTYTYIKLSRGYLF